MRLLIGILAFCLLAGSLFAISGATVSGTTQLRWTNGSSASSVTTEGGNITLLSLSMSQLTSKWTSFNGNVSGTLRLSDTQSGAAVFIWTYAASNGGDVCVSTGTTFPAGTPTNPTTANIDTVFATTGAPDNAAGTFNTTCPAILALSTGNITTAFLASKTQSNSTFTTCAMNATAATAVSHAFCTAINSTGKNYNNGNANFELIAPSTVTAGQTYYFYAQLN